ncbi:M67 family metallopeptidase [Sphingomonas profundi]|uniref:M67 family metallopeptidase n=1 Tax=Alterirhizorhabdus profundi TaxID=2681549 RepID=UPI0012E922CC|nr:M67 family metallopeptidase [Sphingomonas profundi]
MEIATATLERILAYAAAAPDREVCGLLFGDDRAIRSASPAANVAAEPARRFEIDPQALFAAIRAERDGGPRLIGHYHSHPSGEAAPSACDAAAAEPGRLWLIVAGRHAAAFRAVAGGPIHGAFAAVPLAVTA